MNDSKKNVADQIDILVDAVAQIDDLLLKTRLAEATDLARDGNYTAAEEMMQPIIDKAPDHVSLDLMARIQAQKGDLESSQLFWERALQINPNCLECQAALSRILEIKKGQNPSFAWLQRIFAPLGIFFVVLLGIWLITQTIEMKKILIAIPPSTNASIVIYPTARTGNITPDDSQRQDELIAQLNANQAEIQKMSEKIEKLSVLLTPLPSPATIPSILKEINLSGKGFETTVSEDQIKVTFTAGLFLYNWLLAPDATDILKDLGYQLKPWEKEVRISVIGFGDNTEQGQTELTYFRAYKVIQELEENSQLPEDIFVIVPTGISAPPFSNSSITDRSKNRTVMIIIKPID